MNKYKKCSKCHKEKLLIEFHKDKSNPTGYYSSCKECKNKYMSNRWKTDEEYRKNKKKYDSSDRRLKYCREYAARKRKDPEYRKKNKEYMKQYWTKNNAAEYAKIRRETVPWVREKERIRSFEYRKNNKEKALETQRISNQKRRKTKEYKQWRNRYEKNKRNNDKEYKLLLSLRTRILKVIKNKSNSSRELLGCDISYYIKHIESQFVNGMNWNNHGKYWHIDHIVPCNYFNLKNKEDQKICFNYRNTQPLSIKENCSKQDNLPDNYKDVLIGIKKGLGYS